MCDIFVYDFFTVIFCSSSFVMMLSNQVRELLESSQIKNYQRLEIRLVLSFLKSTCLKSLSPLASKFLFHRLIHLITTVGESKSKKCQPENTKMKSRSIRRYQVSMWSGKKRCVFFKILNCNINDYCKPLFEEKLISKKNVLISSYHFATKILVYYNKFFCSNLKSTVSTNPTLSLSVSRNTYWLKKKNWRTPNDSNQVEILLDKNRVRL